MSQVRYGRSEKSHFSIFFSRKQRRMGRGMRPFQQRFFLRINQAVVDSLFI